MNTTLTFYETNGQIIVLGGNNNKQIGCFSSDERVVFGSHEFTSLVSGLGFKVHLCTAGPSTRGFFDPKTSYIIIIINETDLKSSISSQT